MAGREILMKAVLQAIPTYVMSCFLIPTTLLKDIEKMVRQYCIGFPRTSCVTGDCTGVCRRWAARRIRGLVSPEIAEAYAAREPMVMAKEMGWTHIKLEGD